MSKEKVDPGQAVGDRLHILSRSAALLLAQRLVETEVFSQVNARSRAHTYIPFMRIFFHSKRMLRLVRAEYALCCLVQTFSWCSQDLIGRRLDEFLADRVFTSVCSSAQTLHRLYI
jgi:hypothetical protein